MLTFQTCGFVPVSAKFLLMGAYAQTTSRNIPAAACGRGLTILYEEKLYGKEMAKQWCHSGKWI